MADDNDESKPPKINVPKKKVVKRQTKKLPKINLSDSAATGGRQQIPKAGVSGEPKADTSRIDLPPDEAPTLAPQDIPDAASNTTMRISIDQEVIDEDTTEVGPKDSKELTEEISLDNTETGKLGIPSDAKTSTSRIPVGDLDEELTAISDSDAEEARKSVTMPINVEEAETQVEEGLQAISDEAAVEAQKGVTMPINLDEPDESAEIAVEQTDELTHEVEELAPSRPDISDEELFKSTTVPMTPLDEADSEAPTLAQQTEDIVPTNISDEELLKATTVPMEPIDEDTGSEPMLDDDSEELTVMPDTMMEDMQKATTMPMSPLDDDGQESSGQSDEDLLKSTTVPMDQPVPTPPTAKPARKKTMKISRADVKTSSPASPPSGAANRPRTIKLRKPSEQQDVKTVKLQKAPSGGGAEKKSTSRIELPPELQEAHTDPTPSRKKTIKLKRAGEGEAGGTASTAKTLQLNRPNRPASVMRPASVAAPRSGEFQLDSEEPAVKGPGVVWAIVALLSLLVSGGAVYFLYEAYKLVGSY